MPYSESHARRILVAGSKDRFRPHLLSLLRGERFEIIEADQERDACAWIRTNLVDAAIIEQSFFEVMQMQELHPRFSSEMLPLVVCGNAAGEIWHDEEPSERMVMLPEPFSKKDLLSALRTVRTDTAHQDANGREMHPDESPRLEFLGRLAAGVVHDFNNLLTIILGAGEILATQTAPNDPHRVFVEQIQQAAHKSAALIQQLKELSKNRVPKHHLIDLNDALSRVQTLVRHLLGASIAVEVELADNIYLVEADQGQIEQIIMNLALNARDAMPHGGLLRISTSNLHLHRQLSVDHGIPPGSYVALTISDTGVGMDESTLGRLFEPFFSTKEPGRGSGLGLVNVQSILHSCGGHIAVSSKPQRGTTFTLFFPRAESTAQAS